MTREVAINVITNADLSKVEDRVIKAIFYLCTNKALEQEPRKDEIILTKEEYGELVSSEFDNGYTKGYTEALEQNDVLDKIIAEIKALSNANPSYWHSGDMVEREEVLEIIDKYKESEKT